MTFEHACSFCGLRETSATPVMLSHHCDGCGCVLESRAMVVHAPASELGVELPRAVRAAVVPLGLLLGLLMLFAAGRLGYEAAGAAGCMVAAGAAGYLLLPFVPERL